VIDDAPLDLDEPPFFRLRSYQRDWKDSTTECRTKGFTRLLLDAVGGSGKTSYAGALMREEWDKRQGRSLILENRQQLVAQTAKRIRDETGLEVDIEMGAHTASPFAHVVVASVASIGRHNRLTAFPDNHFALAFADEAHNSTAALFLRTMRYFHYGSESLTDGWEAPKDGTYSQKAVIIGITATPDTFGKRNLGNFFQRFVARYSYLQAIEDGWLVGLREVNIPVKIDTRKFRRKMSGYGTDFSADDESEAIIPIIEELSEQIFKLAAQRKTMCFLPSKECALLMAAALNRRGLKALCVLGESLDRGPDTDEFQAHGPGICLCLCAMYVEGTDFPDVDTVAWMRATISPSFYKQGVFRCSRALPGLVSDEMTAEERRAAIAASAKPYSLLISPFFISDRVDLMSAVDLFVDEGLKEKMKKAPADFTDAAKIRDFIKSLEDAANKHKHRQARTIDPVKFALSIGDDAIAHYVPESSADSMPATKAELDFLLAHKIDTTAVKNSGQAQKLVQRIVSREELGLASPTQLDFLRKLTKEVGGMREPLYPENWLVGLKKGHAGAIIGRNTANWRR
jgi:superfamily II DNA or RNA helicase